MQVNLANSLMRSEANGPGVRFVLWAQGCPFHCSGCWNPDTWDFTQRHLRSIESIVAEILTTEGIEGVTFTGGEPFAQARAFAEIGKEVRRAGLSVFIFTGYEYDELTCPEHLELLSVADVLVSGRYVEALNSGDSTWCGSTNQRVHFLTDRYHNRDMNNAPRAEVHIAQDGTLVISGFPPDLLICDSF